MAEENQAPPTFETEPPFDLPEEMPSIPDRLWNRVRKWLPVKRFHLTVETARDSYRTILVLRLHGQGHEVDDVCAYLKGYADKYCSDKDTGAKFRVRAWKDDETNGAPTRRQTQFDILSPYEEPEPAEEPSPAEQREAALEEERRALNDAWVAVNDANLKHAELAIEASQKNQEAVTKMARDVAGSTPPVAKTLEASHKVYRDGLQAKVDAVEALAQLRQATGTPAGTLPPPPSPLKPVLDMLVPLLGPVIQAIATAFAQRGGGQEPRAKPVTQQPRQPAIKPASPAPQVVTLTKQDPPGRKEPPPEVETVAVERRDPPTEPLTLRGLAVALVESINAKDLLALTSVLDDMQQAALMAITNAQTDDEAARAVAVLADSFMANPAILLSVRDVLNPRQLEAFQQLAALCKSHCEENDPTVELKREFRDGASP